MTIPDKRLVNLAGFLACAGMMSYALYAQFQLYLDPCPLCIFQRVAVIGLGIVFLLAAPDTRLPTFLTILGFLAIVGGVAVAIMKDAWVNGLVEWWARQAEIILRVWGVLIAILGGVIIYAAL
ncbi:MAG: disulfide bond formation protein B [Proteobacteria bacterium]|nr:disulfide bond formation protein B [Pseudomonadota bacterium]